MGLKTFHRGLLLIFAAAIVIGTLWWKCTRDPGINFLPSDSRAEWIVFPAPVQAGPHRITMLDTVFRTQFQLNNPPKFAQVLLRAARRVELRVNGKSVDVGTTANWKEIAIVDVQPFLQSGLNKIEARVFNDDAPPALWLRLSTDDLQLRSDRNWEASFVGSAWRPAILSTEPRYPQPGNLMAGGERVFAVLPKVWPVWIVFGILAVLIVGFGDRLTASVSKNASARTAILAGVAGLGWIILFWNNTQLLPFHCGYDSTDHVAYIKYIQERKALPLPTEGFEAFQPPLYYALSAAALSVARLTVDNPGSIPLLRTLTMCFGIAHFVIVLLCLRLLFPARPQAQLVGLLMAAFLPMQLYLSHYATNETLADALVSLAIYLGLRVLKKNATSVWEFCGLGLCVGAAMLAKATALLLIPPLFCALVLKMAHDKVSWRNAIFNVAATLLAALIVCGWYYAWIWQHFGTPIVGNWERVLGFDWWQNPGFHTSNHYLRFGRALIDPLFSGYNGFADGIYSTLWGDGLTGGLSDMLSRTPWNYDLMIGGYWLALVPTLLIAIGAAVATYRFVRHPSPEWFLLIGFSTAVTVALVFMTLRVASYAQIKAFYALSMLVPLCAFAAAAWEKLGRAPRFSRMVVAALLQIWAFNSFFSVWIQETTVEHIYAGRRLVRENRLEAAANEAEQALRKEPSSALAQCFLAAVLDDLGRSDESIDHTMRGLQLDAADGHCQIQNAINVAKRGDLDQAITTVQRLVRSEPENARAYDVWFTCVRQQQINNAVTIGRDALAVSPFDFDLHYRLGLVAGEIGDFSIATQQFAYTLLLQPSRLEAEKKLHLAVFFGAKGANAPGQLSAIAASPPESPVLLNELAWVFATNPNPNLRNGAEAIRLSERACGLTKPVKAKFILTLAAAYAEAGRFSDGIAAAQQAVSLARMSGDTSASELAEKLLDALQQQQPYREEPTP